MYLIKSASNNIAKNGKPFIKLSLVSDEGLPVSATCFTELKSDGLVSRVIESKVNPNDQFPNVLESELKASKLLNDYAGQIPPVFLKYVSEVPSERQFVQLVVSLLEKASKDNTKVGKKVISDSQELYNLYKDRPAAKSMHHAFAGGLALHTYEMLKILDALWLCLPFQVNLLHCVIGILFHDWGKLQEYKDGDYTEAIALTPHGFLGAEEIGRRYKEYLKPRTLQLVQHIVLSHHGRLEWGSTCVPATLEAFLVHHIDMLSGHGTAMKMCENMEQCASTRSMVIVP